MEILCAKKHKTIWKIYVRKNGIAHTGDATLN